MARFDVVEVVKANLQPVHQSVVFITRLVTQVLDEGGRAAAGPLGGSPPALLVPTLPVPGEVPRPPWNQLHQLSPWKMKAAFCVG